MPTIGYTNVVISARWLNQWAFLQIGKELNDRLYLLLKSSRDVVPLHFGCFQKEPFWPRVFGYLFSSVIRIFDFLDLCHDC